MLSNPTSSLGHSPSCPFHVRPTAGKKEKQVSLLSVKGRCTYDVCKLLNFLTPLPCHCQIHATRVGNSSPVNLWKTAENISPFKKWNSYLNLLTKLVKIPVNHRWNCFTAHRLTVGVVNSFNSPHYSHLRSGPKREKEERERMAQVCSCHCTFN